jgi:hypothetical protein
MEWPNGIPSNAVLTLTQTAGPLLGPQSNANPSATERLFNMTEIAAAMDLAAKGTTLSLLQYDSYLPVLFKTYTFALEAPGSTLGWSYQCKFWEHTGSGPVKLDHLPPEFRRVIDSLRQGG